MPPPPIPIPPLPKNRSSLSRSRRSLVSLPSFAEKLSRLRGTPHPSTDPVVACAGGGIFFFWQLGAARALVQHRARIASNSHSHFHSPSHSHLHSHSRSRSHLHSQSPSHTQSHPRSHGGGLRWAGSSAGALCAALSLCDVCPEAAVRSAHAIAVGNGVYDKPAGLAGVWGSLIQEWLEGLLPDDAHLRCSGRLTVLLSVFCGWRRGLRVERVNKFRSRKKLIDCLLGSIHLPWFLDGRPFRRMVVNGCVEQVCDGSAAEFVKIWRERGTKDVDCFVRAADAPGRKPDFWINHAEDKEYVNNAPGFTDLVGVETAVRMVERGFSFMSDKLENNRTASLAHALTQEEMDRWAWFVEAGFGGKQTAGEKRPRRQSLVDERRRSGSLAARRSGSLTGDHRPSRQSFM